MSGAQRSRRAMLDTLTAASPAPPSAMMGSSRALRSAREAVDTHRIWELDPVLIDLGDRLADRFDPSDIDDLQVAIETNGQTVPILVRRNPNDPDRYLLVYGRRRLEAVRRSTLLSKVRALVAVMDGEELVRAQINENAARRDLTYIEKAVLGSTLLEDGFGSQTEVADVLNMTPSAISMALGVVKAVGADLARAIGPAPGVGRPRWQELSARLNDSGEPNRLVAIAVEARQRAAASPDDEGSFPDPSCAAFEAVLKALSPAPSRRTGSATATELVYASNVIGSAKRRGRTLQIDLRDGPIADWFEEDPVGAVTALHQAYERRFMD